LILLASSLPLVSSQSIAEPRPLDGQVSGLNADVAKAVGAVEDPAHLTEAEAKAIRAAMIADEQLDEDEHDLCAELTRQGATAVTFTLSDPERTIEFTPSAGEARRVLAMMIERPNLLSLIRDQEWERLVELARFAPGARRAIDNSLIKLMMQARASSGMLELCFGWRGAILELPEPTRSEACKLVYAAAKRYDDHPKGGFGENYYLWAKPETPPGPEVEAAAKKVPPAVLRAVLAVVRADITFSQVRGPELRTSEKKVTFFEAKSLPPGASGTCESEKSMFGGTQWTYRLRIPVESPDAQRELFESLTAALRLELAETFLFREREFQPYKDSFTGHAEFSWRGQDRTVGIMVAVGNDPGRGYEVRVNVHKHQQTKDAK